MFFSLCFFIGKTSMFEHRNLSKNLFRHVLLDFDKRLELTILSVVVLKIIQ